MTEATKELTFETVDKKSESLTQLLESAERKLDIIDKDEIKISDDLRIAYFKIQALARKNDSHPRLQQEYNKLLDKYNNLQLIDVESVESYQKATTELLNDINNLTLDDWRKLKDSMIDWWLYEMIIAFANWLDKCKDKIIQDFEETVKFLVSPDDWIKLKDALVTAMSDPVEFSKKVFGFIKSEFYHIYRDVRLIYRDSTVKGNVIEMSEFIPGTILPLIISNIGPWKMAWIRFLEHTTNLWKDVLDSIKTWWKLTSANREKIFKYLDKFNLSIEWNNIVTKLNSVKDKFWFKDIVEEVKLFEIMWDETWLQKMTNTIMKDPQTRSIWTDIFNYATKTKETQKAYKAVREMVEEEIRLKWEYWYTDKLNKLSPEWVPDISKLWDAKKIFEWFKVYLDILKNEYKVQESLIDFHKRNVIRLYEVLARWHLQKDIKFNSYDELETFINNFK